MLRNCLYKNSEIFLSVWLRQLVSYGIEACVFRTVSNTVQAFIILALGWQLAVHHGFNFLTIFYPERIPANSYLEEAPYLEYLASSNIQIQLRCNSELYMFSQLWQNSLPLCERVTFFVKSSALCSILKLIPHCTRKMPKHHHRCILNIFSNKCLQ